MASRPKKSRTDQSLTTVSIRLCDSFQRTQQEFICPFIRAKESVRVLYKVQQESRKNILTDAGNLVGMELISIKWCPLPWEKNRLDGNIFIGYKTSREQWDENKLNKFKDSLRLKLSNFNIRNVLVDQVGEQSTLSQPIITEIDYKITELDSRIQNHLRPYQNPAEPDIIPADLENIRTLLKELKEGKIQIALLSHNDVGKSFLLNLLLLLTAENTRKLRQDKNIKLPQDLKGNPTVKEVIEGEFEDLPEVIKDFLDEITDDEQDFKNIVQPICHELLFTNQEELRNVEESFRCLSEYHIHRKRVDLEPYLLPQKDSFGSYNTTTNCVFHLRYGSSFQAQVKYFNEKELQDQLFELVLLENGSAETRTDLVNKKMQEKSRQSLMARFRILTEYLHTSTNEEEETWSVLKTITSPKEVRLCEQVKQFAGKTELHIGNGNNSDAEDRLALQKLLKEYTLSDEDEDASRSLKQKIAALKSLVVYVPSTLLYGGAEILELPGISDSDPLAMGFIQDALDTVDSVLLLSEFGFRIAGQEVKDCLTSSDFIKKWKNNSNDYKLMFLSYPEKNNIYQFGESDCKKIENIGKEEPRKKLQELQEFEEILHPDCLTADMKKNISSYTLLPVLHSSIHALEGEPHHILQKKRDFLKYTGIDSLTTELDRIIMQKKKNIIEEIEKKLEDFEACHRDEKGSGAEDDSPQTAQEMNFDQETKFVKQNEDLFNKLKKKHEDLIKESVDGLLKSLLQRSIQNAVSRWTEIESDITDAAIFNPQYRGRHAAFKWKMDEKLFGDLNTVILPIFRKLTENLHDIFNNYKKMAIELFTKELKKVSPATVGRSLECALGWFLGTTRASFNESTLMKSFQDLFKESIKKHILEPSYRDSIESTRRNMEKRIQNVLCELQKSFLQRTISLYNEKWPENLSQFMVRSCISVNSVCKSKPRSTFCGKLRCSVCHYMESSAAFTSTKTRKEYQITESFTCITSNVIYLITCKKCKMQYVGQTVQAIGRRFTDHLSRIKCKNNMLVSQHFNSPDHSVHDISLVVIEKLEKGKTLSEREKYWIKELGTRAPAGLNAQL